MVTCPRSPRLGCLRSQCPFLLRRCCPLPLLRCCPLPLLRCCCLAEAHRAGKTASPLNTRPPARTHALSSGSGRVGYRPHAAHFHVLVLSAASPPGCSDRAGQGQASARCVHKICLSREATTQQQLLLLLLLLLLLPPGSGAPRLPCTARPRSAARGPAASDAPVTQPVQSRRSSREQ
jgi:hypothetical protein